MGDIYDTNSYISFAATNGQHGSGRGYIQVTSDKMNFMANASVGEFKINDTLIQDYPTVNISKDTTYYWTANSGCAPFQEKINSIEIMGQISHDWGNMYAKFYHFRMFDKNLNMICDLWPTQQNGQVGIIDKCSNIFWAKTHLNGSFIFGSD